MPVWPTWSVCGRQPGARDHARAADGGVRAARRAPRGSRSPSAEPTPRPPRDDDLGVGERDAARRRRRRARAPGRRGRRRRGSGAKSSTAGAPPSLLGGDGVRGDGQQRGSQWRRASSSRLPPQRMRVDGAVAACTAMQFAANGRSVRAATWAITSLPLFVPAATMALGAECGRDLLGDDARPGVGRVGVSRSSSATWASRRRARRPLTAPGRPAARAPAPPSAAGEREGLQRQLVRRRPRARSAARTFIRPPRSRCISVDDARAPHRRRCRGPLPACPGPRAPPAAAARAASRAASGVLVSTGFWRARSLAGTDG